MLMRHENVRLDFEIAVVRHKLLVSRSAEAAISLKQLFERAFT